MKPELKQSLYIIHYRISLITYCMRAQYRIGEMTYTRCQWIKKQSGKALNVKLKHLHYHQQSIKSQKNKFHPEIFISYLSKQQLLYFVIAR